MAANEYTKLLITFFLAHIDKRSSLFLLYHPPQQMAISSLSISLKELKKRKFWPSIGKSRKELLRVRFSQLCSKSAKLAIFLTICEIYLQCFQNFQVYLVFQSQLSINGAQICPPPPLY